VLGQREEEEEEEEHGREREQGQQSTPGVEAMDKQPTPEQVEQEAPGQQAVEVEVQEGRVEVGASVAVSVFVGERVARELEEGC
jgi:hypothetical protein